MTIYFEQKPNQGLTAMDVHTLDRHSSNTTPDLAAMTPIKRSPISFET